MPVYFEGKRKKVRYGRDLVEVRFGKKTQKEAFAVFSADDNSLNFYKRFDIPKVGELFEGKTVTEVYTGIEKSKFTNINQVPWFKQYQSITKCIVVDEIKPMSTAFWFALSYMTVCDVSKLDTTSTQDMWNMFMAALRLYELKLGKNFTWQGEQCYPPIQTAGFVPNADGKWYALSDGKGYMPSEIPSNKADTYYASTSLLPKAFAIYSDDDKSLNFYKRAEIPKAGEQFDGRTATEVYPFDENKAEIPWRNGQTNSYTTVTTVNFKDVIKPTSTAFWFSGFTKMSSIDLKKLDTSNVTNMSHMFADLESLYELDLSTFNTSKVINMAGMFEGTYSRNSLETINLSSFDTRNVMNMSDMFSYTSCTSLDLSSFDVQNVFDFDGMFLMSTYLSRIYTSNKFIVETDYLHMFRNDEKLIGGKGTTHDFSKDYEVDDTYGLDYVYARIDNPPSAPGYFTEKNPNSEKLSGRVEVKTVSGHTTYAYVYDVPQDASLIYTWYKDNKYHTSSSDNLLPLFSPFNGTYHCVVTDNSGKYFGNLISNKVIVGSTN